MSSGTEAAVLTGPQANKVIQIVCLNTSGICLPELSRFQSHLSSEESNKAGRFHFAADKKRYVVGHGVLRALLGLYLNCDPKTIEIDTNSYGKPFLKSRSVSRPVYFNVSDSGDYVIYAINRAGEIGIDIEQMLPDCATQEIAEQFFSDNEVSVFRTLPAADKVEAFYNCWTRKEAFIKAIGEGLSYPLKDFDVTLAPGEPAKLLSIRGSAEEASAWTLQEIPVARGYKAAFVVRAKDAQVTISEVDASALIASADTPRGCG